MTADQTTTTTATDSAAEPAEPAETVEPAETTADRAVDAASLSTQPAPPAARPALRRSPLRPVRRAWRQLTSMRTALVLLFLLALAAVPGSLLPQRPLNPIKVDRYLQQHRTLGPLYDRLGMFDVFASPWFAAIYLLLFVSLIGCLTPRIRLHLRALRAAPPAAPKRFDRLPESASYTQDGTPQEIAAALRSTLRRGRWRVVVREDAGGATTVSAEKGYLRETGNLVFHIALTVILVGIAVGKLWGYQGTVIVEEGKGFCNAVQQYDAFHPGRQIKGDSLAPFCIDVDSFRATYADDGTATSYDADIRYTTGDAAGDGAEGQRYRLAVNSPLRVDGARVYLINHGFSPKFTIRTSSGQVFSGVTAPFVPQDASLTSEGALKLPDASPDQLAIDGLFAPDAVDTGGGVITSRSPQPRNPMAAIFLYRGNLGLDSGTPQSVYSLDRRQIERGVLKKVGAANLAPGESLTLSDGTSVRFDGYIQWASLQIARDPGQRVVLVTAVFLVLGLLLSLGVRRRRLWFRLTPDAGSRGGQGGQGRTVVAVGGLARTDSGVFTTEFARIVERLDPARQDGSEQQVAPAPAEPAVRPSNGERNGNDTSSENNHSDQKVRGEDRP